MEKSVRRRAWRRGGMRPGEGGEKDMTGKQYDSADNSPMLAGLSIDRVFFSRKNSWFIFGICVRRRVC